MHENICLQCNKISTGPSHRLVRDSCGHEKCRVCLLEDEHGCKQCATDNQASITDSQNSIKCDINGKLPDEETVNHTGVIQLNGNVQSSSNLNGETAVSAELEFYEKGLNKPTTCETEQKVESKDTSSHRVKKSDKKKSLKRSYSSIIIPKHVNVILDPLSYYCTLCNKSFTTKTNVKYHVYCAGANKPFKCDVCGKEFILRAQLDVHSYKHKSTKPYSCHLCNKSFSERSKLTRHSAIHSNIKSHICSTCGNAYRSKESLKIHLVTHKSEKPFACKLCSAKFSTQMYLNKHSIVHKKEKTHMCDLCGKRYKQKWALTVHKSSHTRGKTLECNICFKKFNYSKDLQRHGLVHAEFKQYKCSICSATFRRKDNLRRHMKNIHPGKKGEVLKNVSPNNSSTLQSTTVRTANYSNDTRKILNDAKPVDNPNAINVITTVVPNRTDIESISLSSPVKFDSRAADSGSSGDERAGNIAPTTVINGPIKLAFKTPAFKSHYNINRDFNYMPPGVQLQNTYNMAESVEICQKILSTDTSLPVRSIIRKAAPPISTEICQKIMDANSTRPLHYETSFQNAKHAMIKNIKFKVPAKYTNQFKDNIPRKDDWRVASVIVNSNDVEETENLHWRRRTSQNLNLKN